MSFFFLSQSSEALKDSTFVKYRNCLDFLKWQKHAWMVDKGLHKPSGWTSNCLVLRGLCSGSHEEGVQPLLCLGSSFSQLRLLGTQWDWVRKQKAPWSSLIQETPWSTVCSWTLSEGFWTNVFDSLDLHKPTYELGYGHTFEVGLSHLWTRIW